LAGLEWSIFAIVFAALFTGVVVYLNDLAARRHGDLAQRIDDLSDRFEQLELKIAAVDDLVFRIAKAIGALNQ
jgi:hypothetical protein